MAKLSTYGRILLSLVAVSLLGSVLVSHEVTKYMLSGGSAALAVAFLLDLAFKRTQ